MTRLYDPAPRNRRPDRLPVLAIRIDHAGGTMEADPNAMALAGFKGALRGLAPLPGLLSVVSGDPAVLYRADDYAVPLTPEELDRFARHALSPAEVAKVGAHVGEIFEIHADFYDADGGMLQPIDLPEPEGAAFAVSCRHAAARRDDGLWDVTETATGRRVAERLTWDSLMNLSALDLDAWPGRGDGGPLLSMDEILGMLPGGRKG